MPFSGMLFELPRIATDAPSSIHWISAISPLSISQTAIINNVIFW
jgi:hypothetical protein